MRVVLRVSLWLAVGLFLLEPAEGRQFTQQAPLLLTGESVELSMSPRAMVSGQAFDGPHDALRHLDRFVPFTESAFKALPDTATLWVAFALERAADAPALWVLTSRWYHTRAYIQERDSVRYIGQTGLQLPLAERQVADYVTSPSFRTELVSDHPVVVLLEVRHDMRSYGSAEANWDYIMRLYTASQWEAQWEWRELISLLYVGAMLALGLYHLLLFFSLRNAGYLWFAGVVIVWGLCWGDTAGVVSSIFYPKHLPYHLSAWFYLLVSSIALVHGFSAVLLELRRSAPVLNRFLVTLIWMYVPIVVLALLRQWEVAVWAAALWAVCGLVVQLSMGIALAVRQHPLGRVYLAAIALTLLGGFVYIFTWLGWMPRNDVTVHSFLFGSLGQSLFFSLALATRIKLIEERQQQALTDEAQARQRLQSLQKQDALKSELLGLASHDLKSPLHNILGFTELLQQRMPSHDEAKQVPLHSIQRSAEQMLEILEALLQTSAIEQGRLSLKTQLVNLGVMVGETLEAHRTHAEAKQQHLKLDAPGTQDDYQILGDPVHLRSILDNLTSNAIKYADAGATTTVSLIRMNGTVHVDVKDEGPGLSQEDQQRLFQPFQRLSPQPTGGETSTGVGLMAAKRLVELHGGQIRVRSMLGKGTTFTVILPHAWSAQVPAPSAVQSL